MKFIQRYGLFPTGQWGFREHRHVYEHKGWTVYVDKQHSPTKWVEVFAHQDGGPLWCVAEFAGRSWERDVGIAQEQVDLFLEWLEEQPNTGGKPQENPTTRCAEENLSARVSRQPDLALDSEKIAPLPPNGLALQRGRVS